MSPSPDVLRQSPFLRLLPAAAQSAVFAAFKEQEYAFGVPIVQEGEPADAFFILLAGRARVVKLTANGEEVALDVLRPGDSFGEIGLLTGGVRTATVRASEAVTVLRLDRQDFDRVLAGSMQVREYIQLQLQHRTLQGFLRQYTRFAKAPLPMFRRILELIQPASYPAGRAMIREGETGGSVFIIARGRATVYRDAGGQRQILAYLRPGDYFGELSLLQGSVRTATVEAASDCEAYVLSPGDWERLRGEFPELNAMVAERVGHYRRQTGEVRQPLDFVQVQDAGDRPPDDPARAPGPAPAAAEPAPAAGAAAAAADDFPFVPQSDDLDSGVAALAMVCRYFGRQVSSGYLRELAGAGDCGAKDLGRAAMELGLAAQVVKRAADQLPRLPRPALLQLKSSQWVVLVDVAPERVRLADPAVGRRWVRTAELAGQWNGHAVLFEYSQRVAPVPAAAASPWAWLAPLVRPARGPLAASALLAAVLALAQVLLPVGVQRTLDLSLGAGALAGPDAGGALDRLIVALGLALIAALALAAVQRRLLARVTLSLDRALLECVFERLLRLPLSYFLGRSRGEIRQRLAGVRVVRQFLAQHAVGALLAAAQALVILAAICWYSPWLAAAVLAVMTPLGGLLFVAGRRLRPAFAEVQETAAAGELLQGEIVDGIQAVKASGAAAEFRALVLDRSLGRGQEQLGRRTRLLTVAGTAPVLWLLAGIVCLWLGGRHLMAGGQLTVGAFVAVLLLVGLLYAPVMAIVNLWVQYLAATGAMRRLAEIVEWPPEQDETARALRPAPSLQGKVEFRNVSVCLDGPAGEPALQAVSFTAHPGQRVGVVGRSGAGKTVLARTLAALLQPASGVVLYDDVPGTEIRVNDLRRQVGLVLEDNYLFHDTVRTNIACGDPRADEAAVTAAARAAGCHDRILALPDGYATRIGPHCLRGDLGLRQGIAIARALCKDPAILVLDDATSGLDVETETALMDGLEAPRQSRTMFLITHRPSLVRRADVILVFDRGRLAEQGSYEELLARRGLFYHLSRSQAE